MKRPEPFFRWPTAPLAEGGRALILGAGLGGCFVAAALAERGVDVTLIDRHGSVACETSGNPRGAYLPLATRSRNDLLGQFYSLAFDRLRDWLDRLEAKSWNLWRDECGIVHLAYNERLQRVWESLKVEAHPQMTPIEAEDASAFLGVTSEYKALHYPQGGSVSPKALCNALSAGIQIVQAEVVKLSRDGEQWQLLDGDGQVIDRAKILILSGAHGQMNFEQSQGLDVRTSLGQLNLVSADPMPKQICCHHGYMIPAVDGQLLIGASWRDETAGLSLSAQERDELAAEATQFLPDLKIGPNPLQGRVGRRTGTPDHLPLCGPMPDALAFADVYADLHHGRYDRESDPPWFDGLYTLTALGARGLLAAPLCAEILTAKLCGLPKVVTPLLERAIHPARYLVRSMKRQRPS